MRTPRRCLRRRSPRGGLRCDGGGLQRQMAVGVRRPRPRLLHARGGCGRSSSGRERVRDGNLGRENG